MQHHRGRLGAMRSFFAAVVAAVLMVPTLVGAAVPASAEEVAVKPTIRGVLDRNGRPSAGWRSVVNGYVVRVDWAALQPTQGGEIALNNAIDTELAWVRQQNAANPSGPQLALKLRVLAGDSAPQWAKNLAGGQVHVNNTDGVDVTIGRYWTSEFGAAYDDLMTKLAAKYDLVPEVRDVVVSRCTLSTAEPFQRRRDSKANLVAAGLTVALDHACHQAETRSHQVWAHTPSSTAFTPYMRVDQTSGVDEAWTASMIDDCRAVLGSRCVLESNGIEENEVDADYNQMYATIKAKGEPIAYQTASPGNGLGSLCNTLNWAVTQGTGAVELPTGYDVSPLPTRFDRDQGFTPGGMSSYDKALEGATPADTDTPTAPSNLQIAMSASAATLSWSPASDSGYGVACYRVFKNGVDLGTTQGTTFTFAGTGFDAYTPYTVKAVDGVGHLGPAASVLPPDNVDPTAPTNLQATGVSNSRIDLSWSAASDNAGVHHYAVYRNGSLVGTPSGLTFSDTGLSPGTTYNYAVTAVDAANNEGPAVNGSGTTLSDVTPPSTPAKPTLKSNSPTTMSLTWPAATDNLGVTGYRVYRNGALVGSPAGTSFTDTGLTPKTTYSYAVSAVDASGNESGRSASASATTQADGTNPTAPTNVRVTGVTSTSASIAWNGSTDNVGVAGYRIYRNGTQVGTTNASTLSFTDNGPLKPNTAYKYTVKAVDTSNRLSSSSNAATATTSPDTQAPDVPVVTVVEKKSTEVKVAWNKPWDNAGVTSYKVLRNGTIIASTTSLTYTYKNLTPGTTYQFSVRAFDAAGNWTESDPVIVTTPTST